MHYASLESLEQEHDEKEKHEEKDKELKSVLKSSSIPSVSTIPSTLQGIDSLPDFQRTKLPSNPHLPVVTIRPHQE